MDVHRTKKNNARTSERQTVGIVTRDAKKAVGEGFLVQILHVENEQLVIHTGGHLNRNKRYERKLMHNNLKKEHRTF